MASKVKLHCACALALPSGLRFAGAKGHYYLCAEVQNCPFYRVNNIGLGGGGEHLLEDVPYTKYHSMYHISSQLYSSVCMAADKSTGKRCDLDVKFTSCIGSILNDKEY